jgi:sugar/nucleoside kinase (ribokinase family)
MTARPLDVVGIGNAIVDVLAQSDDAFLAAKGLAKGSMTLIEADAADRLYGAMSAGVECSGGSAANTMVGVASLGGRAAFLGKIKNDQLGEVFAHDIRAVGVEFTTQPTTRGAGTARCLILVTPDGQRTMATYLGAAVEFSEADVVSGTISSAAYVYMEGYLFDKPSAKAAFRKAVDLAHESDGKVALTLSDSFCVDRHRDDFLALIDRGVDVLFANEAEIKALYRVKTFDEGLQRIRGRDLIVALTRSEAGSVIVKGEEVHVVEATKVPRLVDTTGAGDLYAAGFLFGLARGRSLAAAARLGGLCAAEVIGHFGARPQTNLAKLAAGAGIA